MNILDFSQKSFYKENVNQPLACDFIGYEKSDTAIEIRSKILDLQKKLVSMTERACECPLKHTFAPGTYAREILLPKGSVVVGKIHKHAHINIVSRGIASVMTEFGEMRIDATLTPQTFTSQAGTKRVVVAIEDVIWTTIHLTNETDLEKIESEIIAKDYDDVGWIEQNCAEIKEISS